MVRMGTGTIRTLSNLTTQTVRGRLYVPPRFGRLQGSTIENLQNHGAIGGHLLTEDRPSPAATRKGLVRAQMRNDLRPVTVALSTKLALEVLGASGVVASSANVGELTGAALDTVGRERRGSESRDPGGITPGGRRGATDDAPADHRHAHGRARIGPRHCRGRSRRRRCAGCPSPDRERRRAQVSQDERRRPMDGRQRSSRRQHPRGRHPRGGRGPRFGCYRVSISPSRMSTTSS
jgi:hypothetical protein